MIIVVILVSMARDLFVIRHAKSDWSFEVRDFDRPLNARGFDDAPVIAERLKAYAIQPELLVSSSAKRTLTTAQLFAGQLHVPISTIQTDLRIYEALPTTLLKVVNEFDDAFHCVALFGHNPGLALLINYLTHEQMYSLPTCGLVHIRFNGVDSWAEVSGGLGSVRWFTFPKEEI